MLSAFPAGYAAGATLLLGGAGSIFSIADFERHQPVTVTPVDDEDALACVQPVARVRAAAKLAVSVGIFISPLSLFIQSMRSPEYPPSLWIQVMHQRYFALTTRLS